MFITERRKSRKSLCFTHLQDITIVCRSWLTLMSVLNAQFRSDKFRNA